MNTCKSVGCGNPASPLEDFCHSCLDKSMVATSPKTMAQLYPQYYKSVGGLTEVDVYAVHLLFDIQDPSGAIQHASKKLLLSGARTGGKSMATDIKEARDTLTRWLQLHEQFA